MVVCGISNSATFRDYRYTGPVHTVLSNMLCDCRYTGPVQTVISNMLYRIVLVQWSTIERRVVPVVLFCCMVHVHVIPKTTCTSTVHCTRIINPCDLKTYSKHLLYAKAWAHTKSSNLSGCPSLTHWLVELQFNQGARRKYPQFNALLHYGFAGE